MFWIYLAGLVAMPFAWRPGQTALVRYGILAVIGWPTYLLQRKLWMIVVSFALLGEALGLPGSAWTRRYAGSLAHRGDPAGGAARRLLRSMRLCVRVIRRPTSGSNHSARHWPRAANS